MTRWVLHVDLDEFIAAVEVLRHPELAGLPVIVGGRGDPTERAVVSTASYEARAFGVGSGMPLRLAARKAPTAVILPVDRDAYDAASTRVMTVLRSFGEPVEVLGWDEAFLGVETDDPEAFAARVRTSILDATGLHSSVGIGDDTVRAKIATGFGKPRGVFRLTVDNWFEVMGARPVIELWGVGSRVSARLGALGIRTVRDLADADVDAVVAEFGPRMGRWYHGLGSGIGRADVDPTPWIARGRSRETTFQRNLSTPDEVRDGVRDVAGQVADDIAAEGRDAVRVSLTVRYAPFSPRRTKARKLPAPTLDRDTIVEAALTLAGLLDPDREVRLVGVRAEMVMPAGVDPVERTPIRGRM